jgi:hypothetical protein
MKNKEEEFAKLVAESFLEYSKQCIVERMYKSDYTIYCTIYLHVKK